jgi:hypothetical protein
MEGSSWMHWHCTLLFAGDGRQQLDALALHAAFCWGWDAAATALADAAVFIKEKGSQQQQICC